MKKTIVFYGDSITDAGRNRENDINTGCGYVTMVCGALGADEPATYQFINRGISGNRVIDLLARVKRDLINLKPDYVSILIGVNDVWHEYVKQNGVSAELFEFYYDLLIAQIREALPEVKIMILSPFVLEGGATKTDEEHPGRWEYFSAEVPLRIATAERIAKKHGLAYVPLQPIFDEAVKKAEPTYWLRDGVHPSKAGAELIKREWLKAFRTFE